MLNFYNKKMRTEEILHETRVVYEIEDERDAVCEQWYIREPTILEKILDFFRSIFIRNKPF
jgi:hypothetical protein